MLRINIYCVQTLLYESLNIENLYQQRQVQNCQAQNVTSSPQLLWELTGNGSQLPHIFREFPLTDGSYITRKLKKHHPFFRDWPVAHDLKYGNLKALPSDLKKEQSCGVMNSPDPLPLCPLCSSFTLPYAASILPCRSQPSIPQVQVQSRALLLVNLF